MIQDIKSLYPEELVSIAREMGGKDFQGKQLFQWLHQKQVDSYEAMTNLSKAFIFIRLESFLLRLR